MAGYGKKGPVFVPPEFAAQLDKLSKAALMDIAWNLALLNSGTDTPSEAFAILAHEADIVARQRGDRIPYELSAIAQRERERMITGS